MCFCPCIAIFDNDDGDKDDDDDDDGKNMTLRFCKPKQIPNHVFLSLCSNF